MAFPINVNDVRRTLVPSNGTTEISVDFPFEKEEWLTVKKWDGSNESTLVLTTDYTTTGEGLSSGGKITLVTAANGTDVYSIALDIPIARASDYQKRGSLKSEVVNTDFDRLVQMMQRQAGRMDRALHRRDTDTSSSDLLMPEPPATASYMQLNADGTVSLTGSAPSVTPTYTFILPEEYGAVGDDATDDTAALQSAENAAAAAASATGKAVGLLISGTYLVSDSIQKKANVNWFGHGAIKHVDYDASPTLTVSNQFALVFADGVDGWCIDGIRFFSIPHSAVISNSLPKKGSDSSNPGNWNSIVDATNCDNWCVRNCVMRGFSQGIKYDDCENFSTHDNDLDDESGYTVASMIAGTYSKGYSQAGTFGIGQLFEASGPSPKSHRYVIANNRIATPGLDLGISAVLQTFDEQPGIVSGNYIHGAGGAAIQLYRGSYTDAGGAPTYDTRCQVVANFIYGTWEQGIHLRGITGAVVHDNYLWSPGQCGSAASLCGGIIARINPYNDAYSEYGSSGTVAQNSVISIEGNVVVNVGRDGATSNGAIVCRIANMRVRNNVIVREDDVFTSAEDTAIEIGGGELTHGVLVEGNEIDNFDLGVNWGAGASVANGRSYERSGINRNRITACTKGIHVNADVPGPWDMIGNQIDGASGVALRVRSAPRGHIRDNVVNDCGTGLQIATGCLASDIPAFADGISAGSVRRGGTLSVRGNEFWGVTTPTDVIETASGDPATSAWWRCAVLEGNLVDGGPLEDELFAASPATGNVRTARVGQRVGISAPAIGYPEGWVCSANGTGGQALSTTGDVTNGSPTVTNIADISGFGPGTFVSIDSTTYEVKSVDSATQITLASNFGGSTNTGEAITGQEPTWLPHSVVARGVVNSQTGTAYTLAATDAEGTVTMDNVSTNAVTIPTNAAVAIPVGTRIKIIQKGSGATDVDGDTGVTLNGVSAGSGRITAQWDEVVVEKIATNEWLATGDIGAVS